MSTIRALVHHRIYCDTQRRLKLELHRHDSEKRALMRALGGTPSSGNVNAMGSVRLDRRESLRLYAKFAGSHKQTAVQSARAQVSVVGLE